MKATTKEPEVRPARVARRAYPELAEARAIARATLAEISSTRAQVAQASSRDADAEDAA